MIKIIFNLNFFKIVRSECKTQNEPIQAYQVELPHHITQNIRKTVTIIFSLIQC